MEHWIPQTGDDLALQVEIDAFCDAFEFAWSLPDQPHVVSYFQDAIDRFTAKDAFGVCQEIAKIDMEFRWMRSKEASSMSIRTVASLAGSQTDLGSASELSSRPTVDDYLDLLSRLGVSGLVAADFVSLEYRLRCDGGLPTSKSEYLQRFPERRDIDSAIAATDADISRGSRREERDQGGTWKAQAVGTEIGHFRLEEIVGHGAFGSVWRARDLKLDRIVAVKVPKKNGLSKTERQRFLKEARITAQLNHPHIVSVHEAGDDGETMFIVSDFVSGETLADYLKRERPSLAKVVKLVRTLCRALQHAHESGVIHRDLKPSNVILDHAGQPHITDFGLAKYDFGAAGHSVNGQILGTPAYMSPEQALGKGEEVDARSDVYSLGVVLFEMLVGEVPFRGASQLVIHRAIHDDPPRPRTLNPLIPKDLETICLKCIEKSGKQRYHSAEELDAELARFEKGEPIEARSLSAFGRCIRWCRRKPFQAASIALLTLIAVVSPLVAFYEAKLRSEAMQTRQSALKLAEDNRDLADEAQRRTRDAVSAVDYLIQVIRSPDPNRLGRAATVADTLETAANTLKDYPNLSNNMKAKLYVAIGDSQNSLGLISESVTSYESANEFYLAELGPSDERTLDAKLRLAMACDDVGDTVRAMRLGNEVAREAKGRFERSHPLVQQLRRHLNNIQFRLGNFSIDRHDIVDSVETLRKRLSEIQLGPPSTDLVSLRVQSELALRLIELGNVDEGLVLIDKILPDMQSMLGANHATTISTGIGRGIGFRKKGDLVVASQQLEQSLAMLETRYGNHHSMTLWCMRELAKCYELLGHWGMALEMQYSLVRWQLNKEEDGFKVLRQSIAAYHRAQIRYSEAMLKESSAKVTLLKLFENGSSPVWGSDHEVAYYSLADQAMVLEKIDKSGETNVTTLMSVRPEEPRISPDGTKIVFTAIQSNGGKSVVRILDVATKVNSEFTHGAMPTWSEDSKTLFYFSPKANRIVLSPVANPLQTANWADEDVDAKVVLVSPDGNLIAHNRGFLICVSDRPSEKIQFVVPWISSMLPVPQMDWSQDGRYLAIGHAMPLAGEGIWVLDIERGECFRLIHGNYTAPRWSPDGRDLVVECHSGEGCDVYQISVGELDTYCDERGVSCLMVE